MENGQTLLGPGWTAVENFDDLDDDEYEEEEEVRLARFCGTLTPSQQYVVLDLGTSMDARTLQTEATYQLVVSYHIDSSQLKPRAWTHRSLS